MSSPNSDDSRRDRPSNDSADDEQARRSPVEAPTQAIRKPRKQQGRQSQQQSGRQSQQGRQSSQPQQSKQSVQSGQSRAPQQQSRQQQSHAPQRSSAARQSQASGEQPRSYPVTREHVVRPTVRPQTGSQAEAARQEPRPSQPSYFPPSNQFAAAGGQPASQYAAPASNGNQYASAGRFGTQFAGRPAGYAGMAGMPGSLATQQVGVDVIACGIGTVLAVIGLFVPIIAMSAVISSTGYVAATNLSVATMFGGFGALLVAIPIVLGVIGFIGIMQANSRIGLVCTVLAAIFNGCYLTTAASFVIYQSYVARFGMFLLALGILGQVIGAAFLSKANETAKLRKYGSYRAIVVAALKKDRAGSLHDSSGAATSGIEISDADLAPYLKPKSKLVAGFAGVFAGMFGVHNFYRGRRIRGAIQLGVTLVGAATIIAPAAMAIWGLVEGVCILCADPGSGWRIDSRGIEMHD
ncbi:TM2 domain-containing protein [Bifidobacterium choloepi]|uniref:NINE protein n=1 Tax=Bifidobacterium choloepi TaxID=2614131 RepID=A0A6I5N0P2_9BIFI|nr:TM2 domain-containing protein [Bifidobacterium choloepi]NEG69229.1 NINE protein [Bifidobacterium choloepi]